MKKILFLVAALLSLGIAMPTLKAQPSLFCLKDLKPGCAKHLQQDTRAIHVDVCKKPGKTVGSLVTSPFEFKAPEVLFSREAMIFRTVNFVFSPYDNRIDATRNWKLQVNFGIGAGFVDIPFGGSTLPVNFPSDSNFVIQYRGAIDPINPFATNNISDDNTKEVFIKKVTQPYVQPDEIWKINGGNYVPPTYASLSYPAGDPVLQTGNAEGFAYVKLGVGHSTITKPIVIVDGVDFNSEIRYEDNTIVLGSKFESKVVRCGVTGWDIFSAGAEDSWLEPGQTEAYREFPKLFDNLRDAGFDIIFLDFSQGATFIQKNALVLKALLNRINATKVADINGYHENIVIGASMGGQVARMALAQMERDKQAHCTRMYVSFDSPQKGANIPLSLQAISWMLKMENLPEEFSGNWVKLNMPAAKQMLTETLGDAVTSGKVTVVANRDGVPISQAALTSEFRTNTLRGAYVQEMAALGYPRQAQNIAIVDGDITGKKITGDNGTPFPNNASLINATPSLLGAPLIFNAQLFALNGSVNLPGSADGTFFKAKISECFLLSTSNPVQLLQVSMKLNQNLPNLDNAPGCIRGDFRGLRRLITDGQTTLNKKVGGLASIIFPAADFQPNFCFMPTSSTLDIRDPKDASKWNWYANPNILTKKIDSLDLKRENTYLTPFFDYYAPKENLRHVEVDSAMRVWAKQYFIDTDKDALSSAKLLPTNGFNSYNYSYRKNRVSTVTINAEGTLAINETGNSAFNTPNNLEKSVFDAYLGGDCDSSIVRIKGGTLQIGSIKTGTRSATLSVGARTKIIMDRGTLTLSNDSKIFIHSGGEVIIKGGLLRLSNLSQIIVENGGTLTIYPNAVINLYDLETKVLVQQGGTLHLKGVRYNSLQNAQENFQFTGNGHFAFNKGNILTMEDDLKAKVDFKWIGDGKNKRFIVLNGEAILKIPNRNVEISKGTIQYNLFSKIEMKNGGSLTLKEVIATGKKSATGFRIEEGAGNMYIYNSDFSQLGYGIDIHAEENAGPKMNNYSTSNSYNILVNTNVNFNDCVRGFSCKNNSGYVYFYNNTKFSNNTFMGAFIDHNSGYVGFSNCQIEENSIGAMVQNISSKASLGMNDSYVGRNAYGIVLRQVKNSVFSACIVENHDEDSFNKFNNGNETIDNIMSSLGDCSITRATGILDLENSNIILTDETTVQNNNFGVYKNNEKIDTKTNPDALVLDCTKFINNIYGIKGKNIALQADAIFNQSHIGTSVRPNKFIQGEKGIYFFDICYDDSPGFPIPTTIFLRENFWETKANGSGKAPDPMTINFKNDCTFNSECEHCSSNGNCIPYETDPEVPELKECNFFKPDPNDPQLTDVAASCQCNTTVKSGGVFGEETPVHAQFRSAYANLLLGKKADAGRAFELFRTIAELPIEKENSECNHYITMARAFIDYYPGQGEKEIFVESKTQKTPKSNIKIYPNPATDRINISLPKGNFDISIMDNQGRTVFNTNSESETIVNTNNWLSGIYHVSLKNTATGEQSVQKVVVMKMD